MNKHKATEILKNVPLEELRTMCSLARSAQFGKRVDLCAILNAKNGACSEDCAFCAQSKSCGEPMLETDDLHREHKRTSDAGIHRFSLVTSGKGLAGKELDRICHTASLGKDLNPLCASLGILDLNSLQQLKKNGLSRYHHNLETSRNFFPSICTTHTWEDRVATVKMAKQAGLSVCSGGIMGIGESEQDRIDLAFSLKELEVDSIALNFYIPVQGATVEAEYLSPETLLRIIAMFRLVNKSAELRICAGRAGLENMEEKMFSFGVTGVMTGMLLTTSGSQLEDDFDLIDRTGFQV